MKYTPTIGLEIHAEMKTASKMFCDCPNNLEEQHPNQNTCPVCLAHPGTLPVANKKAIENVIKVGLAIGGEIAKVSKFDRKNYFYPDIPKGYQISQYDEPLVSGGELSGVKITRVHLEEDTANSKHDRGDFTLIDFNRAGVPLMELVTEPVIYSAEKAREFAKELQLLLRYLGVSDADMEKGHMRVEVNISVSKDENFGTKVEVKNINSFSAVFSAIEYETKRQAEAMENGEEIVQETRGWDDIKKITVSQRKKEGAKDYRYFPEPDLPPINVNDFGVEELKASLPELPKDKRVRFASEYNLNSEAVEFLINDRGMAEYFEEAVSSLGEDAGSIANNEAINSLFNYLSTDLRGLLSESGVEIGQIKITPDNFGQLISMITKNEVTSRVAKDVLRKMFETGLDPRQIVQNEGLSQVSDESALLDVVRAVIAESEKAVLDYKGGNTNSLQFLIGKSMGKLKGRGNPAVLKNLFEKELS